MKYIISERQYRLISEQSDLAMDRRANAMLNATGIRSDKGYKEVDQAISKAQKSMGNADPHIVLAILEIGTAFIPVAGPFISLGIGLLDAGLYYQEGDKSSAGISAVLSLLPFVGKIPGVKETSSAVWKAIASKMASGAVLTKAESDLVKQVASNAGSVKTLVSAASKKLSPLVQQVKEFKPRYVRIYGQDEYEKLLRDFLTGKTDDVYFLKSLQIAQNAQPGLANFVTKFGIKFGSDEISQIQKIARDVYFDYDTGMVKHVVLNTKAGPRTIRVFTVSREWVAKHLPKNASTMMLASNEANAVFIMKDNVKDISLTNMGNILTHEFAHIKDPSIVKSSAYMKKYETEYLKGLRILNLADKARELGNTKRAQSLFNKGVNLYYLDPREIIANNAMVLQSFATNTKNLVKRGQNNSGEIIKILNGVTNWTKGSVKSWSDDVSKILGYDDPNISYHFNMLKQNPTEYRKFLAKLAQQSEYLKSQVKIAK